MAGDVEAAAGAVKWYLLGVVLSVLAMVSLGLAQFGASPRIAVPLGFVFTMFGVMAISQPAWLARPGGRRRLLVMNSGVFIAQAAILYASLIYSTA